MDYFWKENKSYLVAVGAGLAFWFVYDMMVLSPLQQAADRAATDRRNEEMAYEGRIANGVPTEDTLLAAERELDTAKELLASLQADLRFNEAAAFDDSAVYPRAKDPEKYERNANDDAETHYSDVRIKLLADLKRMAVNKKIVFPSSFGLEPAGDRPGERLAENLLKRLAIIERVCGLAIHAGVERIEAIDGLLGLNLDRFEFDEDETPLKKFLERDSIQVRFTGNPRSVFQVLHGVQRPGAYLAVPEFEADRSDPTKELLKANLVVSLLTIDPEAFVEPREEEE